MISGFDISGSNGDTVPLIFVARMPAVADSQPENCTRGYSNDDSNSDYELHMSLIRIIHELEIVGSQ